MASLRSKFTYAGFIVFMILPAVVFWYIEDGWTYLDSLYFSFVTLTTVGFGDYVAGKLVIRSGNSVSLRYIVRVRGSIMNPGLRILKGLVWLYGFFSFTPYNAYRFAG